MFRIGLVCRAAPLTGAGRLGLLALLPAAVGDAERSHGLLVDLAGRMEPLALLEVHQGCLRPLTKYAVGLSDVEPLLVQHDLHLPDFIPTEIDGHRRTMCLSRGLRAGRSHREERDYAVAVVDNDDVVTYDEVHVVAPFRMDRNQRLRNCHDVHSARHDNSRTQREVNRIEPRYIVPGEYRIADFGALLLRQGYVATGLGLLSSAGSLLLTLLGLRLLSLTLLGLSFLALRWLSLLKLPSLSLSLRLVWSLALLAFAAARLLSLPALLMLGLAALFPCALAGGLLALALSILLMLHPLSLLALRGLTCGLLALAAAFATLGLALAVRLLRVLLRLAAATLRGLLMLLSG